MLRRLHRRVLRHGGISVILRHDLPLTDHSAIQASPLEARSAMPPLGYLKCLGRDHVTARGVLFDFLRTRMELAQV